MGFDIGLPMHIQEQKLYYSGRKQDHILQTLENGIPGQ